MASYKKVTYSEVPKVIADLESLGDKEKIYDYLKDYTNISLLILANKLDAIVNGKKSVRIDAIADKILKKAE